MLYKMVIPFGKVIGVMIIATALTVFKATSVKDFTEIYLQNIHTLIAPENVNLTLHFLVLPSSSTVSVMRTAFDTWNAVNKLPEGLVNVFRIRV